MSLVVFFLVQADSRWGRTGSALVPGMKVTKGAMAKIGKPGYTAERIRNETGLEMAKETSGMK